MKQINVSINKSVFNELYYPFRDCTTRIQVFFGGASSGKSVFLAQRRVLAILEGGRNYLCCRNVGRTIKTSIFNETTKIINSWGLSPLFKVNKSDLTITCKNKYQMIFKGLDDIEKIKSITPEIGVLTDIDVEEATECIREDIKQLMKRLRGKVKVKGIKKRITFSFNPILQSHWIYKDFFAGKFADNDTLYQDDNLLILHSTYLDNKFLEEDDKKSLKEETDKYFYDVYTLGKWGILGDVIFSNFEVKDILNDPIFHTFDKFKNGLDFGFTNDPTAFTRSYYQKATKTIWIFKEWGGLGYTNDQIANALKPIITQENVICDSAEPKSIQELNNQGISAQGAVKGKDSIRHGINWLKQQKIIIDKTCTETLDNFQQYCWRKNKQGEILNEPVDKFNDYIDNLRYAYEDEMDNKIEYMPDEKEADDYESLAAQADW